MSNQSSIADFEAIFQNYLKRSDGTPSQLELLTSPKIQSILKDLQTSVTAGIQQERVPRSEAQFGTNRLSQLKTRSLVEFLCQNFEDPMIRILMVAAVVSIIVQYFYSKNRQLFWVEGATIIAAVLVCSVVGTFNNYKKQKQFEDLFEASQKNNKYDVLREGQRRELSREEIVVGDLVLLNQGIQIPADGLVVKAEELLVNQGAMTGESLEIYKHTAQTCQILFKKAKDSPSPVVLSGSSVLSGEGRMICLLVGSHSRQGKLNSMLAQEAPDKKTPLELKLEELAQKIVYFGFFSGLFLFVMLLIWLLATGIIPHGWNSGKDIYQILQYLMLAVALIVMAVPEGLPLAVTLALAFSVNEMLKQDNLVKQLASCETMGSVHILCTDKTGTLTANEMAVSEVWNGQKSVVLKENPAWKQEAFPFDFPKQVFYKTVVSNSSAVLHPLPKGSPTALSLLKFAQKVCPEKDIEKEAQRLGDQLFLKFPFSSLRKRSLSGLTINGEHYLLLVGAAEIILRSCDDVSSSQQNDQGREQHLMEASQRIDEMAGKGLRVLALAFKKVEERPSPQMVAVKDEFQVREVETSGFRLLLLAGIGDGVRGESKKAIEDCHRAGISVIMVTGDNSTTAKMIAGQLGITGSGREDEICMEGPEFDRLLQGLSDDQIYERIKNLKVLARSQPQDKYRLVETLKRLGNVVAVTGDGTNDVPALIKADVGVAMGVSGTQVAKNAADIVMMKDDLGCIVRAVVWGRNIYLNVRKFLQFQLTVNVVVCVFSIVSSTIFRQSILTVPQMLWVNLIMDSLASLALATQPPNSEELLGKPPVERDQGIITRTMMKHIIGQAIFQTCLLMFLLILGPRFLPEYPDQFDKLIGANLGAKYNQGVAGGTMVSGLVHPIFGGTSYSASFDRYHVYSRQLTFVFNVFVFMQVFNFFNCRKINDELNLLGGLCNNKLFWIITLIIVIVQWCIVYLIPVPFQLYNFHGLTVQQWALSLLFAFTVIPVSLLLKLLPFCAPEEEPEEREKGKDKFEEGQQVGGELIRDD